MGMLHNKIVISPAEAERTSAKILSEPRTHGSCCMMRTHGKLRQEHRDCTFLLVTTAFLPEETLICVYGIHEPP
jgi:hypothetical protein